MDAFDQQFGLPAANFFKAKHDGVPLINYSDPDMLSWAEEAAMDIEWAHAIAPGATIELFEAKKDDQTDLLAAVNQARMAGNVSVVSMSFGQPESPLDDESNFQPTTSGTPMTFVASSGDQALLDGGIFPAVSGQVLAVGGTDLLNNNFEGGWGNGGGGFSSTEPEPFYQMPFQSTASVRSRTWRMPQIRSTASK